LFDPGAVDHESTFRHDWAVVDCRVLEAAQVRFARVTEGDLGCRLAARYTGRLDHGIVVAIQDRCLAACVVETIGESKIELLEPTAPDSPVAKFLEKNGPGVHHIAYSVPDIEAAITALKAAGNRMIDEVPRVGAHGARIAFIHPKSSGGVLTEICS
jgi:methylmalonyl-CoA epimerase